MDVKGNGKAKVDLTQNDLPAQLLASPESGSLQASIMLGSFGSATPLRVDAFQLRLQSDPDAPPPTYEKPLRYGKMPEIHHNFREDPRSPPVIISLAFLLAVSAVVPGLFVAVRLFCHPIHLVARFSSR